LKSTSYDGAIDVVTDLREGGDVRGSPLAVMIVLELSQRQHKPCRGVQGGLVVYPLAGVYTSHEKNSIVGQWVREDQDHERLLSLLRNYAGHACEQARQLIVNCN
jgi:hypothetical protein